MKNVIKGNLSGYLCEDCHEKISNVKIRLYLAKDGLNDDEVTASEKDTFRLLNSGEIKIKRNNLVGEGITDHLGNFEIELSKNYSKGALEFDFECSTVPHASNDSEKFPLRQFHITTWNPKWEYSENQQLALAAYSYILSHKWWCFIRGVFFDSWVICGRLLNCNSGTPISDAKVTAMDADFLTDDTLGHAITDSNGHFKIYYNSKTFKQTFLSPLINVETDPGLPLSFKSGPDVYFHAELAGTTLVNETKANARKNVGYCLCVRLCSEINVVNPNEPDFPSAWTGIGTAFSASFGTNSYDFDADGFAGAGKNAIYSVIRLTGQAALKSGNGNPIEYRFRISNTTTPNGGASPDDINFDRIIGVEAGLFVPSVVLKLTRKIFVPVNNTIFVESHQTDFDGEGWYDANKAIDRALLDAGLTPADLTLYNIIEEDTLMSLDTRKLTTENSVSNTIQAGETIPAGELIQEEKFAIKFEIREVIDKPNNQFNDVLGSGKTLNSVVMNNNPVFMKLAIKELEDSGLCNPISGNVHAKYTVYHPYLVYANLKLNNNSLTVNKYINDTILPNPFDGVPTSNQLVNASALLNNSPNDLERCTYSLKLRARSRLHNGDNAKSVEGPIEQLFFYDV